MGPPGLPTLYLELPSGLIARPLREAECLTAGDDPMIDGADIY
jgi:hypothetical protein